MALDFPSSPTNGQTYNNYYYDATVGAWNSFSSTVNTVPSTLKNLTVTTDDAGLVPFTVNGVSGQSVNLQNWKNSAGTTVASINNDGVISAATLNLSNDLTVSNGGTGAGTFTTGAYLKGNGTSAIQAQTGIPFADVTMQNIGAAADLNTYVTQGIYHQNSNAQAAGGANYPVALAGLLEVFQVGTDPAGFTYQRYTVYQGGHAVWTRSKYLTVWGGWQQVPVGTVTVEEGGTGATTLTSGAYLKGAGTSAITTQTGIPTGDITSGILGIARGGTGVSVGTGLVPIIPTSVGVNAGTATVNATTGYIDISGVTTLDINSCFSTTYRNYKIIWSGYSNGNSGIGFRLRSGTTTESGAIYGFSGVWYGTRGSSSSITASNTTMGGIFGHNNHSWSGDITAPAISGIATGLQGLGMAWATSDNATEMHIDCGMIRNTTAYNGLTFLNPSAGTLTGRLVIYGYVG